MQGGCKVFKERSAAGRTCLIHEDIGNNPVLQPDRLHILAADVQNKRGVFYIFLRCPGMGYCLYRMVLCPECLCEQLLAVAGSACRDNMKPASRLSVAFSHINERTAGNLKGRTFIRRVKRIQDLSVFSKQDKFCSRASGINSQPCGDVLVFFNSGMAGFCFLCLLQNSCRSSSEAKSGAASSLPFSVMTDFFSFRI